MMNKEIRIKATRDNLDQSTSDFSKPFLTYKEVANLLNISEITLRKWVCERNIPFLKLGRSVRFDPVVLERWLKMQSIPAEELK